MTDIATPEAREDLYDIAERIIRECADPASRREMSLGYIVALLKRGLVDRPTDLAALRDRLGHIVDRYGDAHDAQDCAVLYDLRALLDGAR